MVFTHNIILYMFYFCKGKQGSPSEVLQTLLENDEFADIRSRITSRGVYMACI